MRSEKCKKIIFLKFFILFFNFLDENYKSGLLKSIEEIAANPDKWERLDANKKEDFFNMTRKYEIRVKTKEDIEEERREKERILQEQYEMERQRKLEMERIEKEKYETRMKQISNEISPVSSPEIRRKSSNKKIEKQDRSLSNSPDLKRCRTSNKKIKKENQILFDQENSINVVKTPIFRQKIQDEK